MSIPSGYFCQWCTFYQTKYSLHARSETKYWKWNHYVNFDLLVIEKVTAAVPWHDLSPVWCPPQHFLSSGLLWRQLILTAIDLKQWFLFEQVEHSTFCSVLLFVQDIYNIWSDYSVCCTCGRWSSATRPLSSCSGICRNLFHWSWLFSGVTTSVATSQNISPLSKNVSQLLVLHIKCYSFASFSTYSISLQHHK